MTRCEQQVLAEWKTDLLDGTAGTDRDPYLENMSDEDQLDRILFGPCLSGIAGPGRVVRPDNAGQ